MAEKTLDQMYQDLATADAAGDKELASAIGGQIYSTERQAEARAREQTFSTGMAKAGLGIVEGAKRVGEGFKQLGTAGLETITNLSGGVLAPVEPGTLAQQTSDMNMRRLAATGGDPDIEQAADITEAGISSIPGISAMRGVGILRKLPATTTALQAVLRGARAGAVGAAATTGASETAGSPGDVAMQRLEAAFLGGTLVGGTQLAAGAGASIANFWSRQAANMDRMSATARELQNSWDVGKFPISVQSGNKLARSFEILSQANVAQKYFNQMFERFAGKVDEVNNSIRSFAKNPDASHFDVATRINQAWQKDRAATQSAMSSLYGKRLSGAVDLAAQDPQLYAVPWLNTARVTNEWKNATDGIPWWRRVAPGAEKITPELAKLDQYMTRSLAKDARNKFDVREIMLLRRNINDLDRPYQAARDTLAGPNAQQVQAHRALKGLRDALDADIKAFQTHPGNANRPARAALDEFISANEDYAAFKNTDKIMQQSAVGQMFGFRIPDDPRKALGMLARMEPAEQKRAMNVLRSQDPEAILDLRAALVNDAFSQTLNAPRAASRGRVDPETWAKAMTNEYGLIGSEIFAPAERAQFERGLSTVRLIRDTTEGLMSPSRAPGIEGPVMAVASQSSAFLSRALLRIAGLGKVEKLLFTPEGLKSLETIRNTHGMKTEEAMKMASKLLSIAGVTPEESDVDEYGRQ